MPIPKNQWHFSHTKEDYEGKTCHFCGSEPVHRALIDREGRPWIFCSVACWENNFEEVEFEDWTGQEGPCSTPGCKDIVVCWYEGSPNRCHNCVCAYQREKYGRLLPERKGSEIMADRSIELQKVYTNGNCVTRISK